MIESLYDFRLRGFGRKKETQKEMAIAERPEAPTGTNATLRANAERALARCNDEIHEIADRSRSYEAELAKISASRTQLQYARDELVRKITTLRQAHQRASLELDVAMNTEMEQARQAQITEIDEQIQATKTEILIIDAQYQCVDGILALSERETALRGFVQDCHKERDRLLQKRTALEEICQQTLAAHGRDEWAALESDFAALAADRRAAESLLAEIDSREQALQASIVERLRDWPPLAEEMLRAQLPVTPSTMTQLLDLWLQLCNLAADRAVEVDEATIRTYISDAMMPYGVLARFGGRPGYLAIEPSRRDYPVRYFEELCLRLNQHIRQYRERDRSRQVSAHLAHL